MCIFSNLLIYSNEHKWEKRWKLSDKMINNPKVVISHDMMPTDGKNIRYKQLKSIANSFGMKENVLPRNEIGGYIQEMVDMAEAVGIARGDELLRAHDHQRIRALDALHGAQHGLLDAVAPQPLLRDDIGDDLGIAGGVEDRAAQLQLLAQLPGVDEVAVMAQSQGALEVVDEHGLSVDAALCAGGAVAAVAHGHAALVQLFQHVAGKDLVDQAHVLVAVDHAVVVDGDAAALLPAMLQGVERVVGGGHHAGFSVLEVDAEYAAFLMQLVKRVHAHSPIKRFMIS